VIKVFYGKNQNIVMMARQITSWKEAPWRALNFIKAQGD
jgi:hypothetical protein